MSKPPHSLQTWWLLYTGVASLTPLLYIFVLIVFFYQGDGGGDPDMYVSTLTTTPDRNNYQYASVRFGDDRYVMCDE